MNILVLGVNGFIGQHLKKRLLGEGHTVVDGTRSYHFIPDLLLDEDPIDAIINCAGEITDKHRMFFSNVVLVDRMLRFAVDAKIPKVIHIGSSSEYGVISIPRREDMPCAATDLYSATKIAATTLCEGYAKQHQLDVCVARPFSLYGPDDTPRKLIPSLYRSFLEHSPVNIHPGEHDWIYIDDFIDGLIFLLTQPREVTQGQIFNLGTGISSSNLDVVDKLEAALGGQLFIRNQPARYHNYDTPNWVADITKMRTLGWVPKHDLTSGLKAYVMAEWFKIDQG